MSVGVTTFVFVGLIALQRDWLRLPTTSRFLGKMRPITVLKNEGKVSEPIGDDDFLAVQVTDGLDDDRAILIVGGERISVGFGNLAQLTEVIEKLKPAEVQLSEATHDRFVAGPARQGVHPSKIQ
jgi:hypothetical protein